MLNLYPLLRPLLFKLSPEYAHCLSMFLLRVSPKAFIPKIDDDPCTVMGLEFKNRIGIAAGLDIDGDYLNVLAKLPIGFIEIGGVTPKPQAGNPLPRIFRLPEHESIINRKGFANKGVDYCAQRLRNHKFPGIVGVNIAKGFDTPIIKAIEDYQYCYERLYPVADFVTINISSPNTPQLRELQFASYLEDMLMSLKRQQKHCHNRYGRYVPLTIKIAPDIKDEDIKTMVNTFTRVKIDGIIATNTTVTRPVDDDSAIVNEAGGMSGKPLLTKSNHVLRKLVNLLDEEIPIIAVGGIMSSESALQKLKIGADLIQVYTGLIYKGLKLLEEIGN